MEGVERKRRYRWSITITGIPRKIPIFNLGSNNQRLVPVGIQVSYGAHIYFFDRLIKNI